MKDQIAAERHAYIRGKILKLLCIEYPKGIDFFVLQRVLANINIPLQRTELEGYLSYLTDDAVGYVKLKTDSDSNAVLYAIITPKGLNFIDNKLISPDPGVSRV